MSKNIADTSNIPLIYRIQEISANKCVSIDTQMPLGAMHTTTQLGKYFV